MSGIGYRNDLDGIWQLGVRTGVWMGRRWVLNLKIPYELGMQFCFTWLRVSRPTPVGS